MFNRPRLYSTGDVLIIAPEHIDRSSRLFLKTLEEGNRVFIDGNNFAIQDGGAFVTRSAW